MRPAAPSSSALRLHLSGATSPARSPVIRREAARHANSITQGEVREVYDPFRETRLLRLAPGGAIALTCPEQLVAAARDSMES
jgi:hypothetical protein